MNKLSKMVLSIILVSIIFTGCNQNTIVIPKEKASTNTLNITLNDAIISLANQLSVNNKLQTADTGTITLTSFVDLIKLNQTSQFGRVVGESLFSELFVRGFNVTDFRGQDAISVNKTGEFFITRDITKLSSEVSNTYILVGTYSKIDQNVIINARILDNKTGKLVTSARAMYANDDCSLFGTCNNIRRKIKIISEPKIQVISQNSVHQKIKF